MNDKKTLITRWERDKVLSEEVLNIFKKSKSLENSSLKKVGGKLDLRGFKFPAPQKSQINSYHKIERPLVIKDMHFLNVDFSYAELSYSEWQNCIFENSIFYGSELRHINMAASDFLNTKIIKSNFKDSFLGQNIGENSGSFTEVDFVKCNLSNVGFCFPKIVGCTFNECDLKYTDFDGSRLANCKFSGLIDSSFFRGHSIHAHNSFLWVFNRVNLNNYLNPMNNIDFSDAKLFGVSFTHGINVRNCVLPKDDSALLVENLSNTYSIAQDIIANKWDGEDKRIALEYIGKIFFNKDRQNQPNDIIDLHMLSEGTNLEHFGKKFFDLLKTIMNKK